MCTIKRPQYSIIIGIKLITIINIIKTLIDQPATSLLSRFYEKSVKVTVKYAINDIKVSLLRSIRFKSLLSRASAYPM